MKKTKTPAGEWCGRCRHCIGWDAGSRQWVHVSNDDWSENSCPCALRLTVCDPAAVPLFQAPVYTRTVN